MQQFVRYAMTGTLRNALVILLAACFAVVDGGATSVARADPLSATEVYSQAISAMGELSQPAYVTYRLESDSDGLQVDLFTLRGQVWLNVHGGSTTDRWMFRHRTFDYESEIVDDSDGHRYVSQRSFFDPTWYGAYRALREGMLSAQDPAPPRPTPADAAPTPAPALKTIGVVAVIGPGIYRVDDRGETVCPNGDAGRALHLTARVRDPLRQLSDVIVDARSKRFCMMRFASSAGFGFHGFVEQHYADVGGYWMQTDGLLDGTLRAFGVSMDHGMWRYRLLDMQFPASLPSDTFAPDAALL